MKKVLFSVLTLVLVLMLIAGYMGFVPGLSNIMARPKDLGVTFDPQLVEAVNSRVGYEVVLATTNSAYEGEPIYTGKQAIDGVFTSEEITSVLGSWSRDWAITPFYNVQVKLTGNGGEVSGVLKLSKAIEMAKSMGYSDDQIEKAKGYAQFVNGDLPFYASGTVAVTNNQVEAAIPTLQVGRVTLPGSILEPAIRAAEEMVERRIGMTSGLYVETLELKDGAMNLVGTIPEQVSGK